MTKKVKLHHRVKKFYHKNPFRKFYTLIIFGLILANIFGLIFASDVYTYGSDRNNDWGGGNDSVENHWGLDLNNPEERQGPCDDGWHVPSRGERAEIAIARCNQPGNNCDPSSDLSNVDSYGNLNYISKNGLGTSFKTDFGMSGYAYWSSSPDPDYDNNAWDLDVSDNHIGPYNNTNRSSSTRVRCLKNSIGEVSDTSALGLDTNDDGDYELVYSGKKYTIAGSDLDGYYYRGVNENTDNTTWVDPNAGNGNGYGYGYGYGNGCTPVDTAEWNTATLETNDDGDYELTYDGSIYTIESGDLGGTYQRGINTPYVYHVGLEHNNDWGGGNDSVENHWGLDLNNPEERQGPCEDGWHVPSKGEWQAIAIARCNQTNNSCNPSTDLSLSTPSNYSTISKNGIGTEFRNSFGMSGYSYWSSSPYSTNNVNNYAWFLSIIDNFINPNANEKRDNNYRVRCLKNSIGEVSDTLELGLTTNIVGDYELIYNGKKYTIAGSDLDGSYRRGSNESIKYGIENNNVWGGGNDTVENGYDAGNPSSERQGPCGEGYHVPSRGEWNSIAIAWCHLSSNECTSCDLKHANDWTESNNLIYVYDNNYSLRSTFKTDFGMSDYIYWSSSPNLDYDYYAWSLDVYNPNITPDFNRSRYYPNHVRCLKDSIEDGGGGSELIIPTTENYEVNVGGYTYTDKLPSSMTVTTNNVQYVENETVLGEVSVNFGGNSNATFTELMQIKIPVEGATRAVVKVKHAGSEEYNYEGLTTNRNASCSNGRPTSNQYNGTPISVVNGYVSIYTCAASSFIAVGEGPIISQIIIAIDKGELVIGNETGILDLGHVGVSNEIQEILGEFGANSFWVEDNKGVESGYYTTISVTDLAGRVATHTISANNVYLKTENGVPSYISGATVSDSKVIFGNGITSWHSGTAPVNYFQRLETATEDAGRVGKWGDNLQVKLNIPAHTPSDIYRGTITYTLYDLDM